MKVDICSVLLSWESTNRGKEGILVVVVFRYNGERGYCKVRGGTMIRGETRDSWRGLILLFDRSL